MNRIYLIRHALTAGNEQKRYVGRTDEPLSERGILSLRGRKAPPADVVAVALPVLRHRCITTFAAEASGVTSDEIVNMLLKALKASDLAEI